mmetsp:Transcript_33754/g.47107  ORF Transcript_33754/g.47107 Transcript_33754/m.47107 type:complete len:103 (-) Transcript_33754:166-474(-)
MKSSSRSSKENPGHALHGLTRKGEMMIDENVIAADRAGGGIEIAIEVEVAGGGTVIEGTEIATEIGAVTDLGNATGLGIAIEIEGVEGTDRVHDHGEWRLAM